MFRENKLWTNNGQFVLRPSSLTRLSERFHKNPSLFEITLGLFFHTVQPASGIIKYICACSQC